MKAQKKTLTAAELGEILGISDRRVRQLADNRILIRTGRGAYPLADNVRAYIAYNMDQVKQGDKTTERLNKLKADKLELEIKAIRAESINTLEAMQAWEKVVEITRKKVLTIPKKQAFCLVGCRTISETEENLRRIFYDLLSEISRPDFVEKALGITKARKRK